MKRFFVLLMLACAALSPNVSWADEIPEPNDDYPFVIKVTTGNGYSSFIFNIYSPGFYRFDGEGCRCHYTECQWWWTQEYDVYDNDMFWINYMSEDERNMQGCMPNWAECYCSFYAAGTHIIRLGGSASNYEGETSISFSGGDITEMEVFGSLGQIFHTDWDGNQPNFWGTFAGLPLKSIPKTLFDGITGTPSYGMFNSTFANCTSLTGYVPYEAFAGIDGIGEYDNIYGFDNTFSGAINLSETCPNGTVAKVKPSSTWGNIAFCSGDEGCDEGYAPDMVNNECVDISDPTRYTITYNLNGGTNHPDNPEYFTNANLLNPITVQEPTRENYGFMGWCSDSTLTDCTNEPIVLNTVGNRVLYAKWFYAPFQVTTTEMAAGGTFQFKISASGEFTVYCGDGGTLSGTGVSANTITKGNTTDTTYTCTYSTAGAHTIKFGGRATGYNTSYDVATISFYVNYSPSTKIAGISGSLGAIFPTLTTSTTSQKQPRFYQTFYMASNMTGIIPENLFSGISGAPASNMFSSTFYGCSGLTGTIPTGVFGNLSGAPAQNMFYATFNGCRGLTGTIPTGLFGNISGAPAQSMFSSTFSGCSGLSGTIPTGLFAGISGAPAYLMFSGTFQNCSGLTGSIPSGLFAGISGAPAYLMFYNTFYGCSGLTGSIPSGLFAGISGSPAYLMFYNTFYGCSKLGLDENGNRIPNSYIPYEMFKNITGVGDGTVTGFESVFSGANNLDTTCPVGTVAVTKPSNTWGDAAFCASCDDGFILPDGATSLRQCMRDCGTGLYFDGNACVPFQYVFSVTTTNIEAGGKFQFRIAASGTFSVDCDGGTLSGTWVSGNEIIKGWALETLYACTYSTVGTHTIKFGGRATGYPEPSEAGYAITFYVNSSQTKIAGISGSLGAIFPTLTTSTTSQTQPKFSYTFYGATNMTGSIPENLFAGISGAPVNSMFSDTFRNCSGLTGSIPSGLFGNLTGAPASSMFGGTFYGCSGLSGTIPTGLFGNLSGAPASSMFNSTFGKCSGLTGSIPSGLFGNLSGAPASNMFYNTFYGCSGLTGSIPSGLFGSISGAPAKRMFLHTFSGCSGLTGTIPSGLFGNISGAPAEDMFGSTFSGCSGLTGTIPTGLFGNISGAPASNMFSSTFSGCSGLSGTIPTGLFGNLTGAPASEMFHGTFNGCRGLTGTIPTGLFGNISGAPASNMFGGTFSGCSKLGLDENGNRIPNSYIPYEMFKNITGVGDGAVTGFGRIFDGVNNLDTMCPTGTEDVIKPSNTWGDVAFCKISFSCPVGYDYYADATTESECQILCPAGQWVAIDGGACADVESGFYSTGAPVNYGTTGGRAECPAGLTTTGSGIGADEENDCGRILHMGDYTLRLRSGPRTTEHAFYARVDGHVLHADMEIKAPGTPGRGHLRTMINGQVYSIYNHDLD